MKEVNTVYSTTDYTAFNYLEGNRNLNKLNLERLKKSISEELLQIPIIVNEKFEIVDGQHRFEACKQLEKPIYFIEVKGYNLQHVHSLNAINKKWNFEDYLDGYANMGNQDYIITRKFRKKYGFGSAETLSMLSGERVLTRGADLQEFYDGKFKVTSYADAIKKAERITMCKQYYDGFKRRSFVLAMLRLLKDKRFDFDTFLRKLKFQSTKLVDCTNITQYLIVIEDIYNYKNRKKVRFV